MQAFRAAARRLGVGLKVAAVDSAITAPGLACADHAVVVPRADDGGYIPAVLDAVGRFSVAALIPTIDTDLRVISQHRANFAALGCQALIAEPNVIAVCRDKVQTYRFLRDHQIDTPQTYTPDELARLSSKPYPLFLKPRTGSASQWVHKIEDDEELNYFLHRVADPIIQEFVEGVEHTLDVYVGLTGEPRCVVPRARWQVRGGEVSKGVVVKDLRIMEAGRRVVAALGDSLRGLVTLQCIVTPDGRIRFIEINPRFGGGAPLSIAAGADFPAWLFQELRGQAPSIAFDGFRHGLCMLRYDWSVFRRLPHDLTPDLSPPVSKPPDFPT
jgi:carbamoyl-phosphate synthase large subunit